jgi:hypothetical protein
MMEKADTEGLRFYQNDRARVREAANAHGKLYDSRAGWAAYYRYQPRDMERICGDLKAHVKIKKPKVHVSALRRAGRATADYAPANCPKDIAVVGTHDEDAPLVSKMQSAFEATVKTRAEGFQKAKRYMGLRCLLYWLFVAYSLGVLATAAWFYWIAQPPVEQAGAEPPLLISYLFDGISWILPDYIFSFFDPLLERAKVDWVVALAVVAVLGVFVILKGVFEGRSRRHALDAWRDFREDVYPQTGGVEAPGQED